MKKNIILLILILLGLFGVTVGSVIAEVKQCPTGWQEVQAVCIDKEEIRRSDSDGGSYVCYKTTYLYEANGETYTIIDAERQKEPTLQKTKAKTFYNPDAPEEAKLYDERWMAYAVIFGVMGLFVLVITILPLMPPKKASNVVVMEDGKVAYNGLEQSGGNFNGYSR